LRAAKRAGTTNAVVTSAYAPAGDHDVVKSPFYVGAPDADTRTPFKTETVKLLPKDTPLGGSNKSFTQTGPTGTYKASV
jgi:hypothetical protein